jgi:hypothetical protein
MYKHNTLIKKNVRGEENPYVIILLSALMK